MLIGILKWVLRIGGIVGTVGGAVVFVDTYFVSNSLVATLLLPIEVPIGTFALFVIFLSAAALVIVKMWPKVPASDIVGVDQLRRHVKGLSAELEIAKSENESLQASLDNLAALKGRVTAALLASHGGMNIGDLMRNLKLDPHVKSQKDEVFSVLAQIDRERGFAKASLDGYYKLASKEGSD